MMIISLAVIALVALLLRLYKVLVAKPAKLQALLREQGIDGPSPALLLGNIREMRKSLSSIVKPTTTHELPVYHNCSVSIFPFLDQWRKQYGPLFAFSLVNTQILYVNDPDVVREITTCTSLDLGKPAYQQKVLSPLLGQGVLTSNGPVWAHQRKILAPELYMDKVKGMINLINESTNSLINSWKSMIELEGGIADIKIDKGMRSFSGDVISRACFGSNYLKGEEIFLRLRLLQESMSKKGLSSVGLPGMGYLPTKNNREAWKLEKEVRNSILKVVTERRDAAYEKDLLQMVLEGAENSNLSREETERFIVDNCKNIYLAGYETTAVSATWCLMLLAANQEWQERVRAEVLEVCQGRVPDSDMLRKLKQLTMVINESLRLYSPVSIISREVLEEMKFKEITIPKGVNIWMLVLTLHTDPEIWGEDAYEFRPDRFADGITGACKFPHLYMPFGVGPRVCLGQNLATVELKILLSMILSNFSFSLSPKYIHSPVLKLVIEPEYGVNLLVKEV